MYVKVYYVSTLRMNQLALQVTLLKYILYSVCSLFFHPGSYLLECQEACLFPKKKVHDMLPDWLSLLTLDKKKREIIQMVLAVCRVYCTSFPPPDKHDWLAMFAHAECTGFCSLSFDWRHVTNNCDTRPRIVLLLNKRIQPPRHSPLALVVLVGLQWLDWYLLIASFPQWSRFFQLHSLWCSGANTN